MNININWRDIQIKNVVNNVDMSSLKAPWHNGPYKTHAQNSTKTRIYNFLNDLSEKCWVTAWERSMTFIGSLNQFLGIANLTL